MVSSCWRSWYPQVILFRYPYCLRVVNCVCIISIRHGSFSFSSFSSLSGFTIHFTLMLNNAGSFEIAKTFCKYIITQDARKSAFLLKILAKHVQGFFEWFPRMRKITAWYTNVCTMEFLVLTSISLQQSQYFMRNRKRFFVRWRDN